MWKIIGKLPGQAWEDIDEASSETEAAYLLAEYRLAFGPSWVLDIKEPINPHVCSSIA